MNYRVLYRKYRPTTFSEVVGQNNTIKLLKDSIISNKISHAYIFSGPRGTGKTSTAKLLAKTLNCLNPIDGNPCNECENCLNFNSSNDIYEIDAASNNGVDQIREIVDNIKLLPINSKYKIYIIDEVHMLSINAFNALLLTLEEPPSHVIFILATTNIESVPITILSRCQRLNFRKITKDCLVDNMKKIAKLENIEITDDALNEIALYSDGGMRDALSVLDQLSKIEQNITLEIVQKELGFISNASYEKLIDTVENNEIDQIVDLIDTLKNNSIDFKITIKKLIDILKQRSINALKGESKKDFSFYKKLCFELADSLNNISVNIDSYDMLEIILMGYCNNNCVKETKEPEKNVVPTKEDISIETDKEENTIVKKPSEVSKIRINNCFVKANKEYLNDCKAKWDDYSDELDNKKIRTLVKNSTVVLASDEIILLKVELEDQADQINDSIEKIEELFNKKYKSTYKLTCIDNNSWNDEMLNYKKNIKSGKKYEYIEEIDSSNNISISDVFDTSVVEVK